MRTSIFGGLLLVVAAPLLVGISALLELELEPVILAGVALGAVVALVPDRTPGSRLLGFLAGVLICWASYVVRAGFLPDTSTGRAVAFALTMALCVLLVLATRDRLALWAVLLGAGGFAGAFESAFSAAPTEVLASALSAATSFLLTVAVGFLVCSAVPSRRDAGTHADTDVADTGTGASGHRLAGDHHHLVMEKSE